VKQFICYTDGSCGKDRDGGYACILSTQTGNIEIAGWAEDTTSNRMEMTAAIRGLEYLNSPHTIFLASDSAYMLSTLEKKWYERWFATDQPRPNLDLWKRLVELAEFHIVKPIKIKGHSDDAMNIKVDKMAVEARKEKLSYINVNRTAT
jgi:ribonuclease HI